MLRNLEALNLDTGIVRIFPDKDGEQGKEHQVCARALIFVGETDDHGEMLVRRRSPTVARKKEKIQRVSRSPGQKN